MSTSSTSAVNSSSQIQMDYMKLLVTQLQNQNPLDPMDNNQMATQLTQISQLQQLESMSTSFADVLTTTNRNYANSLLGKNIAFSTTNETTGETEQQAGTVNAVGKDSTTGEPVLGVTVGTGNTATQYTVGLDDVLLVEN
ncbi:MAG: flagellar hook capping FlgD N-terminal domain-containing protein [Sedimentisphaerales bacterium]|jgi:flagellar basal-body rod modification protein FlgD